MLAVKRFAYWDPLERIEVAVTACLSRNYERGGRSHPIPSQVVQPMVSLFGLEMVERDRPERLAETMMTF